MGLAMRCATGSDRDGVVGKVGEKCGGADALNSMVALVTAVYLLGHGMEVDLDCVHFGVSVRFNDG